MEGQTVFTDPDNIVKAANTTVIDYSCFLVKLTGNHAYHI